MADEYMPPPPPADVPPATVKAAASFIRGIFYNADDWPLDEQNAARNIARSIVSAALPIDGPERDRLVAEMARTPAAAEASYDALRKALGAVPVAAASQNTETEEGDRG